MGDIDFHLDYQYICTTTTSVFYHPLTHPSFIYKVKWQTTDGRRSNFLQQSHSPCPMSRESGRQITTPSKMSPSRTVDLENKKRESGIRRICRGPRNVEMIARTVRCGGGGRVVTSDYNQMATTKDVCLLGREEKKGRRRSRSRKCGGWTSVPQ